MNCDICGSEENVKCELFLRGEDVDRIYHLCPDHMVELYRSSLAEFCEDNEYKVNSFLKRAADRMLVDAETMMKVSDLLGEDDTPEKVLDIEDINPDYVRLINVGDD